MKILYVGGVYATEYSLYRECQANPNFELVIACGSSYSLVSREATPGVRNITSRSDIDRIKSEFNPDLVLFRGWCPEAGMIQKSEVLWSQEIMATRDDGIRCSGGGISSIYPNAKANGTIVAYNIKNFAEETEQHWLPRCVSKHWAHKSETKDIPFMVATNLPPVKAGGDMKKRSLDILIKPIVEWDASIVHAFSPPYGSFTYFKKCLKPTFPYHTMTDVMSRVKIYASPTTIWNDSGCISHKTVHAMACGSLTITNRYADIEEILGADGENLIYSNSPEETLEKVKYYLEHEAEREAIAERGYHFIHNLYNWEKHLTRLYSEVTQ